MSASADSDCVIIIPEAAIGKLCADTATVAFEALDGRMMLRSLPGVFCAGEMLDWEAPTGGYLLTACFASGRAAGVGALEWLAGRDAAVSVRAV